MGIMKTLDTVIWHVLMGMPFFERKFNYYDVPKVLKTTEQDLDYLKDFEFNAQYERAQDAKYVALCTMYKEKYCPREPDKYRFFSFDNKVDYMTLRVQIDDLLQDESYIFNDK